MHVQLCQRAVASLHGSTESTGRSTSTYIQLPRQLELPIALVKSTCTGGCRLIRTNNTKQNLSILVCRITQQGLRCGFEKSLDKGQFWFKHIWTQRELPEILWLKQRILIGPGVLWRKSWIQVPSWPRSSSNSRISSVKCFGQGSDEYLEVRKYIFSCHKRNAEEKDHGVNKMLRPKKKKQTNKQTKTTKK